MGRGVNDGEVITVEVDTLNWTIKWSIGEQILSPPHDETRKLEQAIDRANHCLTSKKSTLRYGSSATDSSIGTCEEDDGIHKDWSALLHHCGQAILQGMFVYT